jgi:starch synthase
MGSNLPHGKKAEVKDGMKVLIVSPEVFPFAKVGGLADVAGSLSKSLVSLGCDARVIMPLYGCVDREKFGLVKEKANIRHPLTGVMRSFNLFSCKTDAATVYFIEKKEYFSRDEIYGDPGGDCPDNASRFSFFSKAALTAVKELDFKPDIIHCNDWQSALIPFYLKFKLAKDSFYKGIKVLFTVHNMAYQGVFEKNAMRKAAIPASFFNVDGVEFYGKVNFMKAGLIYSDAVSTVSPRYAEEIMTPEYACGLEGTLNDRREDVYGVLNGVDYSVWSPENDNFLKENFDAGSLEKKTECKKDLLKQVNLPISPDKPLLGSVTRLVEQKGMDLLANITDRIVRLGAGVILLGQGDQKHNDLFKGLAEKYPGNVSVSIEFNEELAHKIEAGCDIFLMPSRYEPCGLNQMYSIKYGTIPVVRATGGLDDVIVDFDKDREKGNGFKFGPAEEDTFFDAIERAVNHYRDKDLWRKLMVQAMSYDHSWEHSAKEYVQLYKRILHF